jgi:hypothetical protein
MEADVVQPSPQDDYFGIANVAVRELAEDNTTAAVPSTDTEQTSVSNNNNTPHTRHATTFSVNETASREPTTTTALPRIVNLLPVPVPVPTPLDTHATTTVTSHEAFSPGTSPSKSELPTIANSLSSQTVSFTSLSASVSSVSMPASDFLPVKITSSPVPIYNNNNNFSAAQNQPLSSQSNSNLHSTAGSASPPTPPSTSTGNNPTSPRDRVANQSTSYPQLFDGRRPFFVSREALVKRQQQLQQQQTSSQQNEAIKLGQERTSHSSSFVPPDSTNLTSNSGQFNIAGQAREGALGVRRGESQGRLQALQYSNQEYAKMSPLLGDEPTATENIYSPWNNSSYNHNHIEAAFSTDPQSTTLLQQTSQSPRNPSPSRSPNTLKATMTCDPQNEPTTEQQQSDTNKEKESHTSAKEGALAKSPSRGNLLQRKLSLGRLLHPTSSSNASTTTASSTTTTTTVNASGVEMSALKLDEARAQEPKEEKEFSSPPQSPKRLFRTSSFGISKTRPTVGGTKSSAEKSMSATTTTESKLTSQKSASNLRFDLNKGGPAKELMAINVCFLFDFDLDIFR